MDMAKTNETLLEIVQRWDPFGYGTDAYETEAVDVVQAVHEYDSPMVLAKKIQAIYEFSFEEVIPLEKCINLARSLLAVKQEVDCPL
ncbi:DUF1871 family protein [Anoxybacteroides tepidamans]|uniref:DUF1871 family protein n=1 Tax=Anoxybacteroides tepidamans TaxID=265948 RepID=UPI0004801452|nr:DUF1871 family protein [Anoxybacillus tepidamans]